MLSVYLRRSIPFSPSPGSLSSFTRLNVLSFYVFLIRECTPHDVLDVL
jgi:hypothetical protein